MLVGTRDGQAYTQAELTAFMHAAGADDAWLVDGDGFVTEAASATALILTPEGVLVTRPNGTEILPGCTRQAIEALAARDGVRREERAFTVAEAQAAREAMIASASTLVLPVVRIDDVPVGDGRPGAVARRLRSLYLDAAIRTSEPSHSGGAAQARSRFGEQVRPRWRAGSGRSAAP